VSAVGLVGVITTLRLQRIQLADQKSQFSRLHFSEQLRFAMSSYESCLNSVTTRTSRGKEKADDVAGSTARDEQKEYDVTGRTALAEIWHRDIILRLDLRDLNLTSLNYLRGLQLVIANQDRPPTKKQREDLCKGIEEALKTDDATGLREAATRVVLDAWRLALHRHKHQLSPLSQSARAVLRLIDEHPGGGIDEADRKLETDHFRATLSETEMYFLLAASCDTQSTSPTEANVFQKREFFDSFKIDTDIAAAFLLFDHNTRKELASTAPALPRSRHGVGWASLRNRLLQRLGRRKM
jgi:hypothetical protein